MNYPKVSIVIPTYNRCNVLKRCLESILSQSYPKELLELLTLDDGSSDNTKKEIPEFFHQMEEKGIRKASFFVNEQNIGLSACREILGKKVSIDSEYILFLDDDACLTPKCLEQLVEYITAHSDAGVVGPRIVFAKNPDLTAHFAYFVGKWTGRFTEKDSKEPIDCDWLDPVCILVRRSIVQKTGGFWRGFYRSHEGTDFCLRVKKLGYKIVYYPKTSASHDTSFKRPQKERLYYLYRNKFLLIRRNFSSIRKIVALSLILLFGLPKYLGVSIKFNKKIVFSELILICFSVLDGLTGKTGPR